ncbi:hypothetical protein AB2M62_14965 [Sphingomonas sp. MMS12-HWE2-04]|uniref:hypothetical protein n=1 Tax=Sphingomonas sp. MMS12-HWE2-04 TaxID=3234199 RepID=UPI00384E07A1
MLLPALMLLVATVQHPAPTGAAPAACTVSPVRPLPVALRAEIVSRDSSLADARVAGNVETLMAHFERDSVLMPEHQPRLFGIDRGAVYYRAVMARLPVSAFTFVPADILPLGSGGLEWGTFKVSFRDGSGGASPALDGKYVHLWRRQADGRLKLAAEAWGYLAPLENPASHWFADLPSGNRPAMDQDPQLAAELAALNAANASSVQQHDSARIAQYAEDAVYLPFAEQPQVGLAAIRSHLLPYIERGRGTIFERVDVGNDGFELVDDYVVEYSRFAVHWRSGPAAGVTSGGGLRLWRRGADCALKIVRQIGTHDYRP